MSKRKICIVTGSRAEYGLLKWLIKEIHADPDLQLQLCVTGTHFLQSYGFTVNEIIDDGFTDFRKVQVLVDGDDHSAMSKSIGLGVISFTDVFAESQPDMVVVLGDRFEIMAATLSAYTLRIPIAHIHGGETTGGALDEGYRHSITKLSSLHFVTAEAHKQRVIQMGERSERVFCVGAPGVEAIQKGKRLSIQELSKKIGIQLAKEKYFVVAYHPETAGDNDGIAEFQMILSSLAKISSDYVIVFSKSNADAGGRKIGSLIEEFVANRPTTSTAFASLGHDGFVSLLSASKFLLGNSSSGIIEAPALKIPTINVGNRQEGRLKGASVIDCVADEKSLFAAIKSAEAMLSSAFDNPPYGDGVGVAGKIVKVLKQTKLEGLNHKIFNDLSWDKK